MKLIFERSKRGRGCSILPECDVPVVLPEGDRRERELHLPQVSEDVYKRQAQRQCRLAGSKSEPSKGRRRNC